MQITVGWGRNKRRIPTFCHCCFCFNAIVCLMKYVEPLKICYLLFWLRKYEYNTNGAIYKIYIKNLFNTADFTTTICVIKTVQAPHGHSSNN